MIDKLVESVAKYANYLQENQQLVNNYQYLEDTQERTNMFLDHCCKQPTYFFSVKKGGTTECSICQPLRLTPDIFQRLHHLPDPIPDKANNGQHKIFHDVYGKETTEEFMTSIKWLQRGMASLSNPINSMPQILV